MRIARIIGFMAALAWVGVACKKDNLDASLNGSYQDEYRFYTKAKINGLPITFNAGEEGYGLETDYTLEDSVVVMSGTLVPENGLLKNAFVLRIRGNQILADASEFRVEKSLQPGFYSYRDESGYCTIPGSYDLKFLGDTSFSPVTYNWSFEDGRVYFCELMSELIWKIYFDCLYCFILF